MAEFRLALASLSGEARAQEIRAQAVLLFPDMHLEGRSAHEYEALAAAGRAVYFALEVSSEREVIAQLKVALDALKRRAFLVHAAESLGWSNVQSAMSAPPTSFLHEYQKEYEELRKTTAKETKPAVHKAAQRPGVKCFSCGAQGHMSYDCPSSAHGFRKGTHSDSKSRDRSPSRSSRSSSSSSRSRN